ncbi:hypothetical protein A2276_02780 [candidate division WOR-1 bacterium RIFOXYA12_FULL_43_27]|nr:MAG: hypothetical protein A2276_02780 [candidate division WOR-1 bacterium RIFOXYA12_FULL_43_27]OGC19366.1 MAG: hypothetical protein A2292_01555 [candidate division WOR-1 bacterium RIFOXYB2_FULL_46_45]OGC30355.1 MAG: hypothetical protein A2232_01555 [candidate division WOR-1 bacterium RIFOXYA2_FULL_46_56]
MPSLDTASTGLKGLDEILQNLKLGDNVVLQVDNIESYLHFIRPYVKKALEEKRNLVYIRFAKHPPLLAKDKNIKVYELDASSGFETFTKQVHEIITKAGLKAFYVFDCLSDLLSAWATDMMIGNFFMVTCPYLFKLDTIAYFAILRNNHSYKTIARIRETTQLLLDIYNFDQRFYVHPLKVWNRYSPTMFLPHLEDGEKFIPVVNSVDAARLAEVSPRAVKKEEDLSINRLCRLMLGREERMLSLIKKYLTLEDILGIKARMIGTGFIGGKAVGMLLARKILKEEKELEPHDSFYIGSDVFYSYIVENGWWELWLEQKTEKGYFSKAPELREKLLTGKFPDEIREQFQQMIEYFGQSPIIVRSSSLLEDSFGNAFAGKYESFFNVSQGSPEERYKNFEETVRRVFASTMSDEALSYRLQRGLNSLDEQMALLVQRVSGSNHKKYFFPFLAGVAFSYNTFVWHEKMDPKAGMVRLVFGLGTRAVNRVEGDYPAIIALDNPLLRPYADMEKIKRFSQHDVDVLNIKKNALETVSLEQLKKEEKGIDLSMIGKRDREAEEKLRQIGVDEESWALTFEKFLSEEDFTKRMGRMLKTLEAAYDYPVDVEFTANFSSDKKLNINIVQCRPLQAKGGGTVGQNIVLPVQKIPKEKIIFSSKGNFMGGNVSLGIKKLIYIDPELYGNLLMTEKYELAREIGRINRQTKEKTILIGPGRWGTRDPSLGVPVNFAEINNISALIEIDDPAGGFMPELSFGSHFFLDLVESNIFYAALFMNSKEVFFNKEWFSSLPSLGKVLKVREFAEDELRLLSDITSQKVVCLT